MTKIKTVPNQKLLDLVLEAIEKDVLGGDVTAIEELIKSCPIENLKAFLPEQK